MSTSLIDFWRKIWCLIDLDGSCRLESYYKHQKHKNTFKNAGSGVFPPTTKSTGKTHAKSRENITKPESSGWIHAGTLLFSLLSLYKKLAQEILPPGAAWGQGGGWRAAGLGWMAANRLSVSIMAAVGGRTYVFLGFLWFCKVTGCPVLYESRWI